MDAYSRKIIVDSIIADRRRDADQARLARTITGRQVSGRRVSGLGRLLQVARIQPQPCAEASKAGLAEA